jgi:uncharacterized protein (DUF1015 family)
MAEIAPLRPLRYAAKDLSPLVAPPYDVISPSEREALAARSPNNVVKLILPEGEDDTKYAHAAELLAGWRKSGVLVRDEQPAFYRYEQSFDPPGGGARRTRRGFLALVRAVPFSERIVLPHERTLSGPKEDRFKLFRSTRTNLSPGFMLYRDPQGALDASLDKAEEIAVFTTPDGIEHRLGKVTAPDAIAAIVQHVGKSTLLIADGHHRYETAVRYATDVDQAEQPGSPYVARPEHRYFMAFLCNGDDPNLVVFATHRLVHSLPSFDWADFIRRAGDLFEVTPKTGPVTELARELTNVGKASSAFLAVGASRSGAPEAAFLRLRPGVDLARHPTLGQRPEVVRRTDVAVLHSAILEHLLGISLDAQAKKTNLKYLQDPREGEEMVRRGEGQVLFVMNPTPVSVVRDVAEAGEVMPQKSTFFYPKVLTGLAIHTLDPTRAVQG